MLGRGKKILIWGMFRLGREWLRRSSEEAKIKAKEAKKEEEEEDGEKRSPQNGRLCLPEWPDTAVSA